MTRHTTGTREEWLDARLDLLKAEKEHTRKGDELAKRRRELPWVRIDKDYSFDTAEGKASLKDLFRGLPIAGQPVGRPVDRRAVASKELLKGVKVVSLDTAQQVRIHRVPSLRRGASRSVLRRLISVQANRPDGRLLPTRYRPVRANVQSGLLPGSRGRVPC